MAQCHAFTENDLSSCKDNVKTLNPEISNLHVSSLQKNCALQIQVTLSISNFRTDFMSRKLKLFLTEYFITKCIES